MGKYYDEYMQNLENAYKTDLALKAHTELFWKGYENNKLDCEEHALVLNEIFEMTLLEKRENIAKCLAKEKQFNLVMRDVWDKLVLAMPNLIDDVDTLQHTYHEFPLVVAQFLDFEYLYLDTKTADVKETQCCICRSGMTECKKGNIKLFDIDKMFLQTFLYKYRNQKTVMEHIFDVGEQESANPDDDCEDEVLDADEEKLDRALAEISSQIFGDEATVNEEEKHSEE